MPHLSMPFSAGASDAATPSSVTEDRLLASAKNDAGDMPADGTLSAHCPQVVAWPNERLVTVFQPDHVGEANAVIHRGEITKMARDCELLPDRVTVKYGFAGRVLLGPQGHPGLVTLPINIHVAGIDHKTLASDSAKISVTVPQEPGVGYFSMVKEISFPVVTGTRPEDYKIFVAFDQHIPGAG